ncbi:PhoU domain-containing protein [Vallitaleaceae bacterium 9-2]
MREQFNNELVKLRDSYSEMVENTVKNYYQSYDFIRYGGEERLTNMHQLKEEIYRSGSIIEDHCNLLIAKQQPVASDLKKIMMILESLQDIKRICDYSVHIAMLRGEINMDDRILRHLEAFNVIIKQMLSLLKSGLKDHYTNVCIEVSDLDSKIDDLYNKMQSEPFELSDIDIQLARYEIIMTKASRFYERIGDHIVNICDKMRQYT